LVFGLVQCAVAEIYLFFLVNPLTAGLGVIVIVGYVLLYTPLKTKTSASTAIGAIPGAMPPLMGWTASANEVTLGGWALFIMLFPVAVSAFSGDSVDVSRAVRESGILMLPVVEPSGRITARQIVLFAIMLVPASLATVLSRIRGNHLSHRCDSPRDLVPCRERQPTARAKTVEKARRLLMVGTLSSPLIRFVVSITSNETRNR
jgi:protoheme IX farnesyltransferase